MNPEKYYDRIEHYLSGNMSEQEQNDFDKESKENPELQMAVDLFQLSQEAIEVDVESDLRQQMNNWQAEEQPTNIRPLKVASRRRRLSYIAAAACVLLLIGTFTIQWNAGNYSNEALASQYYQLPLGSDIRSGSAALDQNFDQAMNAFDDGAFEESMRLLGKASTPKSQYLLAHSYFQLGQFEQAISSFDKVVASNDSRLKEKAEWFGLLSRLEAGQEVQARLVKITADEGHSYHQQSIELNESLNSIWRNFTK
ncbi:MAG: hypothetical protein AAF990_08165 [Bacteroidota bacterium]